MKLLSKPNVYKTTKNLGSRESKFFFISIVTKSPSMFNLLEISKISEINHLPSSMYLFWTYAVCSEAIRDGSTDFNFSAKAFEKTFPVSI